MNRKNDEKDNQESDEDKDNNDDSSNNNGEDQGNRSTVIGESVFHNSCSNITVISSTTSQASSIGSRKSRRSGPRVDKIAPPLSFDPMRTITPEQLSAFALLVSTPIWIFDFIERRNRYANPAALELWSASSLDEFLNRNMNDMSAASVARTQECQNRVERAKVVQDMWTFFPRGKARTVQMTMTGTRLSTDEDHCSILVVSNMINLSPSMLSTTNCTASKSSVSSSSTSTNSTNNTNKIHMNTTITTAATVASVSAPDPIKDSATKQNSTDSATATAEIAKDTDKPNQESGTAKTSCKSTECHASSLDKEEQEKQNGARESADGKEQEEEKDAEEEFIEPHDDSTAPLNHILESSDQHTLNHQMTMIDDNNVINQEILRGVEIIRHLPMAVCQFDMKGRVMFQNPAAYLPPRDEAEGKKNDDDDESLMDDMDTDDESEFYEHLFDQQYEGIQTISNNGRGNFMDRFVNRKVARELLESLQDEPKIEQTGNDSSNTNTPGIVATCNTTTVSIEAELHASTKGRTQWSAIQLRKTKDPVTSRPVILYSAQDKSDAMEAKREREARLQKSEFLAIMAHEIRTPLHQVTGFIDLLELDTFNNPITTTSSSSAIDTSRKKNSFVGTDSNLQNAIFPHLTIDGTPILGRKVGSTSMINTRSPRSSWPSASIPCEPIGNLTFEQRNYIKLLKSSANQLMTVISDVLDYSKLEAGKMKLERIPFELLSVVQGSMEAVRGSCEEKGLHLTLEYGCSDDDDEDDDEEGDLDGISSGTIDRRKQFRRRSFDGLAANIQPPRSRKLDRTHSFNKRKNKCNSRPHIRSNDIPFRILGDPNRLRQVLLNLLSNAVKFTEKGGIHVRVSSSIKKCVPYATRAAVIDYENSDGSSTSKGQLSLLPTPPTSIVERKEESQIEILRDTTDTLKSGKSNSNNTRADNENNRPRSLRILVNDTGMGISKEQQDTIFEKYQQANLSVARNFGGTGLGLSICKLLVEETMCGSIGVDSDEGRGSSFYIHLPIEFPRAFNDETSRDVNGGKDSQENGASMNILVAEDNKINQKLVANMLKRMGHKSTLVENGRQAIDMIVKQNSQEICSTVGSSARTMGYDAVLMDIQMPVMDGLEATRRLRTMGYTDLPIVGLTASVKRSDYIELGFNDWLPKPILMKDLKAKLLKLLSDHSEDSDESSRTPG